MYAPDTYNPMGATTFILYILFAMIFTASILHNIWIAHHDTSLTTSVLMRLLLLSASTLLSFTILSYNMLSFLLSSFSAYHAQHANSTTLLHQIWTWTTHSALFRDFARELVHSSHAFAITRLALTTTMGGTIILVGLGKAYAVKGLWQYLALAQILPVSFALGLMLIKCFLIQQRQADDEQGQAERHDNTLGSILWNVVRPVIIMYGYARFINQVPQNPDPGEVVLYVAFARLLLMAMYPLRFDGPNMRLILHKFVLFALPFIGDEEAKGHVNVLKDISHEGWAVRTLGYDTVMLFSMCLVGCLAFRLLSDSR